MERMQQYQFDMNSNPDVVLPAHVRTITQEDIDRYLQSQLSFCPACHTITFYNVSNTTSHLNLALLAKMWELLIRGLTISILNICDVVHSQK